MSQIFSQSMSDTITPNYENNDGYMNIDDFNFNFDYLNKTNKATMTEINDSRTLFYERIIIMLKSQINDLKHNYNQRIIAENTFIKEQLNTQNQLVKDILNNHFDEINVKSTAKDLSNITNNKSRNDKSVNRTVNKVDEVNKTNENNKHLSSDDMNDNTKKYVEIVGDSHLNAVNEYGLGSKEKNRLVKIKRWSGGDMKDIADIIKPVIRKNPTDIIIHAGSNNLSKEGNIMKEVKNVYKIVKEDGPDIKLAFSNIMVRKDIKVDSRIEDFNKNLKNYCEQNNLGYIDNTNIGEEHLGRGKHHMSKRGTSILANNFINYMNQE